jgi:very-short-patch-repair endonuclease
MDESRSDSLRRGEALANAITRATWYGPTWTSVSHGLAIPTSSPVDDDVARRCRRLAPVLPPRSAISHLTAALLYDVWLPRLPGWLPVMATIAPGEQRPERNGLYVARSRVGVDLARVRDGVHVVAPSLVAGQLAEDLQLVDLVVAIDGLLHRGLCTSDEIEHGIWSRQRGLPMLRRALPLVDGRSESPWETVLRLMHVLCGIAVEPQVQVRDATGEVVARADLRVVGTRRLPEYDGASHRDKRRHERDLERDKVLARLAYERYGYIADELLHHPGQVIRDAEDALGLRHDPRRVEPWLTEFERSSLSPLGYRRLLHRLHRFDKPLRGRGLRRRAAADCGKGGSETGVSA